MTIPRSLPVIPAQPNQVSYGFSELNLFKTYTRDTYRDAFGAEAPAYDPSRLTKTWFDSSADTSDPANLAIYKVISGGQVRQVVMPAAEAATVNLPGSIRYPEYIIAPTTAARGGVTGIWPVTLSLLADAEALLQELGLAEVELYDEGAGSVFAVVYGDEPRRIWTFRYKGQPYGVGDLLASKHRNGIGAPGHWSVGEAIEWIADPPAPTGANDTRPPREVPVRGLLANEKIVNGLMGPMIVRTDKQQESAQAGGVFTEEDRRVLREIRDRIAEMGR